MIEYNAEKIVNMDNNHNINIKLYMYIQPLWNICPCVR